MHCGEGVAALLICLICATSNATLTKARKTCHVKFCVDVLTFLGYVPVDDPTECIRLY